MKYHGLLLNVSGRVGGSTRATTGGGICMTEKITLRVCDSLDLQSSRRRGGEWPRFSRCVKIF